MCRAPGGTLHLDTAAGNHIENSQLGELTFGDRLHAGDLRRDYPDSTVRAAPTSRYNCHGLVFASRRTGVYDSEVIRRILDDDGYVRVDAALPGDILLYIDETGDIEHSAVVVSAPLELGVPLVVSKWGKGHETMHWANSCPYHGGLNRAEYYRLRDTEQVRCSGPRGSVHVREHAGLLVAPLQSPSRG